MVPLNSIALTDEQINQIADHIEQFEAQEQKQLQEQYENMNKKAALIRERISRLVDMHVDGAIDTETYRSKLEEYKRDQDGAMEVLRAYGTGGKVERMAAEEVLKLAQRAPRLFMSSNFDEKRQILGLFTSNLRLGAEKLDVELREPFLTLAKSQDQHIWRSLVDAFRNKKIVFDFGLQHITRACSAFGISVSV